MLNVEKLMFYHELERTLMDYEEGMATEQDLYYILVKIRNNWAYITKDDSINRRILKILNLLEQIIEIWEDVKHEIHKLQKEY